MSTADKDDELTRRQFLLLAGRSAAGAIALGARPGYGTISRTPPLARRRKRGSRCGALAVSFVVNGQARTVSVERARRCLMRCAKNWD